MPTPTYTAEIAELERLINSATKDVSADGLRTSFDLDKAQQRLATLRILSGDTTHARPKHASLNLGGCW